MKNGRYSDAQIVMILKHAEGGVLVGELCRLNMGVTNFSKLSFSLLVINILILQVLKKLLISHMYRFRSDYFATWITLLKTQLPSNTNILLRFSKSSEI